MDGLQAPVLANQLPSQPVEQFRMRRQRPGAAEIARGCHQSLSEVVLPQAVDQNPRGERVVGLRQPAGQPQTPSRGLACLTGFFRPVGSQSCAQYRGTPGVTSAPGLL